MKFNQFAHVKVPFEQKLAELNRIAFLHAGDEDLASNHIYRLFWACSQISKLKQLKITLFPI